MHIQSRSTYQNLEGIDVCDISQTPSHINADEPKVPDYLKETFDASVAHLISKEKYLAAPVNEQADVFAKDGYDLGTFTDIEHSSNTENATPVKQRMRRAPACFASGSPEENIRCWCDPGIHIKVGVFCGSHLKMRWEIPVVH